MEIETWLAFASASIALLMLPGPTILLIVSYAISHGRRVALATVAGVALGDLIAMTTSLVGLGALVLASATLFTMLKWVGAIYLVYLGVKLFRSAPSARLDTLGDARETDPFKVFLHAATVTALNPKSIVFFIAFVPQFTVPQAALVPQFAILIGTFVGFAAVNALVFALLGDRLRRQIARPAVLSMLTRLGGGTLVAMGIATAAARRSAS